MDKLWKATILCFLALSGWISFEIVQGIPSPSINSVCEPGGCGSNPCSYMIYVDGSTYLAKNCKTGGNDFTGTDIWALLNTLDSNLASSAIYRIAIRGGIYTGSTTFAPGSDKGYFITGDGRPTNGGLGGTILNYTGTGSAIDTGVNWNTGGGNSWQTKFSQTMSLSDLVISAPASSTAVLNMRFVNAGFSTYQILIEGKPTAPILNSIGLRLLDVGNANHNTIDNTLIAGFNTVVYITTDHVSIMNSEISLFTGVGMTITTGMDITITNVHFFGDGFGPGVGIDDTRSPVAGSVLTMIGLTFEGSPGYRNDNGGYYLLLGQGATGYIQTNMGIPITMISGQTTLTGTTAGSIIWSMPFRGAFATYAEFVGFANGYQNSGGTAQTITYTTAFTRSPAFIKNDLTGTTTTTTTLTLPTAMGAPVTGWVIVEGY